VNRLVADANMYWFLEELFYDEGLMERFLADIAQNRDTRGFVKTENGKKQVVIEHPIGYPSINYMQGEYELDRMLMTMEEAKIDRGIMKVPCCHEWMSLPMCRIFNDGMARYQRESGGRLTALAVIPPWGDKDSLEELDRCKNEFGMCGIQLCAHYEDKYLDDAAFAPLFEKLNEYKMTAYVHHTPLPVQYDYLYEYNNLRRSYGRCADQTIAVSRELYSGMLFRYPNVKLVHSMLGGGFFTYLHMFFPPKTSDTAARFDDTDEQIYDCFRKNIFFEMSHAQPWGKEGLECAIKTCGADHIVYGSSYPVKKEWTVKGMEFVKGLDIGEEEKELILYKNAVHLYNSKRGT